MKDILKILHYAFINSSFLLFEYCFNIFGLKTYFGYNIWKWLVLLIPGPFLLYLYNENATYITAWALGKTDEIEQQNEY